MRWTMINKMNEMEMKDEMIEMDLGISNEMKVTGKYVTFGKTL